MKNIKALFFSFMFASTLCQSIDRKGIDDICSQKFNKQDLVKVLTLLTVVVKSRVLNFELIQNQTLSPQQRNAILADLKQLKEGFVKDFDASNKDFQDKFQVIGNKIEAAAKDLSHEEVLELYQEIIMEFFSRNV